MVAKKAAAETEETTDATATPPVTPAPATTVPLPTWTDAASIASYITTAIGTIIAVITVLHPGFSEPSIVQTLVPSVSAVIAGVAQIINVITHRSVQKAAIVAQSAVGGATNITITR